MSKWINEMDFLTSLVKKSVYSTKTIGEALDESESIEVVRCKDCDNYGTRWCMGYESFYGLKDDDYCSHAERRKNGNGI